jgi:transposase-like protein
MRETLKKEYSDNLRTYALKAAEKVQNLSQEIERLREYLHGINVTGESEDSKLAHERLETATIMLDTLKSVNDTALSDWRGIIGDELRQQEEIQADIDNIYSKLEELEEIKSVSAASEPQLFEIDLADSGIEDDIDKIVTGYASKSPIPVRIRKKRKIDASVRCPMCGSENRTRVRLRDGYKKVTRCNTCRRFFTVNVDSDLNVTPQPVETSEKSAKCVLCDAEMTVNYPLWPGYSFELQCQNCHSVMKASVSAEKAIQFHQSEMISKKFLDILEQTVHGMEPSEENLSAIATEYGVSKAKVRQGVDVLVHLGRIEAPGEQYSSSNKH